MKAAVNGVPNLSVLDGWWPEGYDARGRLGDRRRLRRGRPASSSTRCSRTRSCRPGRTATRWLRMMIASIAKLAPQFSMHRAVIEYVERYYLPAANASFARSNH